MLFEADDFLAFAVEQMLGDLVVNEDSAFDAARKVGRLGGKVIRDCGKFHLDEGSVLLDLAQPELRCWHVS